MTSVWDSKLEVVKKKGGQAGLENRMSPLKSRRLGKRLGNITKSVSPKRRRKVLWILYKINIKRVLI